MIYYKSPHKVRSDQDPVYHTDTNCMHYQKADTDVYHEAESVEDVDHDLRECAECAGIFPSREEPEDALYQKLSQEDFGPEELGLSRVGERGR